MQKPSLLLLALLLSVGSLFSSNAAFTQDAKISSGNSTAEVLNSPIPDPQVSEVIKNLNLARNNGDITSQRYWESKLQELTHPQILGEMQNSTLIGKTVNIPVSNPEKVLNVTALTSNSAIGGHSVSRECVTGNIYAAIDVYGGANSDTLKIYRSIDNGLHFTQIYSLSSSGIFKILFNQIDVEAVSKGDSTYAFTGISYVAAGSFTYSAILRVRQDGNMVALVGYTGNAVNKYTNIRITSDNARFTSNAYVYSVVTLDSVVSGARNLRSKMSRIQNPFAVNMALTSGYQDPASGQYAYYVAGTAPDSATFQTDIAFVNNAGDSSQVYTLTVVRGAGSFGGGSWLAYTRSNDFGATTPTTFQNTSDLKLKENPRIAATGFHNNSLMTVTRRLFAGGDWDPYYWYSGNINANAPTYTSNYVESLTDTTYGVSVCAMYKGNGSYLFAWNNFYHGTFNGNIFIKGANNLTFGTITQVNTPANLGTGYFGLPDAAFRNVSGDSCFVMWSGSNGANSYVTGGCTGSFVGIGNSSTELRDFRLDQNYPNPFNPTTNISYNIPVSGLVKITLYDVLGSEVATILNENKTAGYYSAVFDGKNLASGAYYYKITFTSDNNTFSQTKKMMLIK